MRAFPCPLDPSFQSIEILSETSLRLSFQGQAVPQCIPEFPHLQQTLRPAIVPTTHTAHLDRNRSLVRDVSTTSHLASSIRQSEYPLRHSRTPTGSMLADHQANA